MGAHVREQDVVRSHHLADVPEHLLRADPAGRLVVGVRLEVGLHLRTHLALRWEVEAPGPFAEALVQHPERMCQVTHDLNRNRIVVVHLGG